MKRALVSAVVLAAALVLQLTVVNRLPLPGAGAPDLVLLAVAALGLCSRPATGAVTGFCAGLCLDLAPPGSYLVGEYALVFCLVGYFCGRLSSAPNRSALLTILAAMGAAAAGEALFALLGLAVSDPQVTWASVRDVFPSAVIYDVVLTPFVLYLIMRVVRFADTLGQAPAAAGAADGSALLARTQAAGGGLPRGALAGASVLGGAGLLGGAGWLAGPVGSRGSRPRGSAPGARPRGPRTPRLREAAARPGDGWVGGAPRTGLPAAPRLHPGRPGRPPRLRPGSGGSAIARPPRTLPRSTPNLRMGAASRRGGSIGRGGNIGRALGTGEPARCRPAAAGPARPARRSAPGVPPRPGLAPVAGPLAPCTAPSSGPTRGCPAARPAPASRAAGRCRGRCRPGGCGSAAGGGVTACSAAGSSRAAGGAGGAVRPGR